MSKRFTYWNSFASVNPYFVSTWDTTQAGSASDTIILPMTAGETVDWGDGTVNTLNTHTYAVGGVYTITIQGGVNTFRFANGGDKKKIISIDNWGNFDVSNSQIFFGCSNLATITAIDNPIVSATDLSYTFYNCTIFDGNVNGWDISNVTDIGGFFAGCINFNQPLNNWDTSNVTSFKSSFYSTFRDCFKFNQDLGNWDFSSTTALNSLFLNCRAFNNGGSDSIKDWDVSGIADLQEVFEGCYLFNQPLTNWDTSSATQIQSMFKDCKVFNQPVNHFDVSNITNMLEMFAGALVFNQPLDSWMTTSITYMAVCFLDVTFLIKPW